MRQPSVPSVVRRLILALSAAIFGMVALSGTAAANEPSGWILPEDDRDMRIPALVPAPLAAPSTPAPSAPPRSAPPPEPQRRAPAPSPATTPDTTPEATPRPTPPPSPSPTDPPRPEPADEGIGFDISYPQCGDEYPDSFAFAIVGVNGGRVFDLNPCFGGGRDPSQLEWAGPDAELYFNTGNPGPEVSRYWPTGQREPVACGVEGDRSDDTADCARTYGWNAAEFAYGAAVEAFIDLAWLDAGADRLPSGVAIWLDVEPANSWRGDPNLNVAMLEGAVAFLESVEVEQIGFYSTPRLWERITGGTDRFSDHPAWHAGGRDRADAERRCAEESAFTGGELLMVQWVEDDLDHNIRCEVAEREPGS